MSELTDRLVEAAARANFADAWTLGGTASAPDRAEEAWGRAGEAVRNGYRRDAHITLTTVLPLLADEVERLEWAWHFRGPGDPGIKIVARDAVTALIREAQP